MLHQKMNHEQVVHKDDLKIVLGGHYVARFGQDSQVGCSDKIYAKGECCSCTVFK